MLMPADATENAIAETIDSISLVMCMMSDADVVVSNLSVERRNRFHYSTWHFYLFHLHSIDIVSSTSCCKQIPLVIIKYANVQHTYSASSNMHIIIKVRTNYFCVVSNQRKITIIYKSIFVGTSSAGQDIFHPLYSVNQNHPRGGPSFPSHFTPTPPAGYNVQLTRPDFQNNQTNHQSSRREREQKQH